MRKLFREIGELVRTIARGDLRSAWGQVHRQLYRRSSSLWFERKAGERAAPPEGGALAFLELHPAGAGGVLAPAGLDSDLAYFADGGRCFAASEGGRAVGVGWLFPSSRIVRRLGYPPGAVYMSGFQVRPDARGRGIYPALVDFMCARLPDPRTPVLLQVAHRNTASQRGLLKAGCRCVGTLRQTVCLAMIVSARIERVWDGGRGAPQGTPL